MTARRYAAIFVCTVLMATVLPVVADESDQAAAAWAEAAAPGPVHALFAGHGGDWTITAKSWMVPGADPIVSESESQAEMILGGRFLDERLVGTVMGQPFEGLGVFGYDNFLNEVVWSRTADAPNVKKLEPLYFSTVAEIRRMLEEAERRIRALERSR